MNESKFFPELNCKYEYRGTTISISQISHHDVGWTYELVVYLDYGHMVETEKINAPYPVANSADEALKAAKTFAEKWVDNKIIKQKT